MKMIMRSTEMNWNVNEMMRAMSGNISKETENGEKLKIEIMWLK